MPVFLQQQQQRRPCNEQTYYTKLTRKERKKNNEYMNHNYADIERKVYHPHCNWIAVVLKKGDTVQCDVS